MSCRSTGTPGWRRPATSPRRPTTLAPELRDAREKVDDAHVDVDQPQRQVGRRRSGPAATPPRRSPGGSQRSAESACPLPPIARYSRSMIVDLIEPEGRGRDAMDVRDRDDRARSEVARVHSPTVNSPRTIIETAWAAQIQPSGTPPPEREGELIGLDGPHEPFAEPPRGPKKSSQRQAPHGVRVEQHQPRQDPDHAQQRRIGRGVPERVPLAGHRVHEAGRVAEDPRSIAVASKYPQGCSS